MENGVLEKMRTDWDARARANAQHFIATEKQAWNDREFYRSGEIDVANEVMPDMGRICGGSRSPMDLRALEIGCGTGRMTRMLARIFGSVVGVDVSGEMIRLARTGLADLVNVELLVGDGATLQGVEDESCHFAFSFIVFQHIPSVEVIESYCREVYRVLWPGSYFKFQVNGARYERPGQPDTWEGVTFTEITARRLAKDSGFTFEMSTGAGDQYYWLWFRKPFNK